MNLLMHDSYPRISEKEILNTEEEIGKSLPDDYKAFLLESNGGQPELKKFPIQNNENDDAGILSWFLGICPGDYHDLLTNVNRFSDRIPENLIPIARDPGGNLILMSLDGKDKGNVYFWAHEEECDEGETPNYDNLYPVADSFKRLIESLSPANF
jgi:SMI1-KNR4 cell-wall